MALLKTIDGYECEMNTTLGNEVFEHTLDNYSFNDIYYYHLPFKDLTVNSQIIALQDFQKQINEEIEEFIEYLKQEEQ